MSLPDIATGGTGRKPKMAQNQTIAKFFVTLWAMHGKSEMLTAIPASKDPTSILSEFLLETIDKLTKF